MRANVFAIDFVKFTRFQVKKANKKDVFLDDLLQHSSFYDTLWFECVWSNFDVIYKIAEIQQHLVMLYQLFLAVVVCLV